MNTNSYIQKLNITDIVINELGQIPKYSTLELENDAYDIKKKDSTVPFLVKSIANQKYELIASAKRYKIAQIAGLSILDAIDIAIENYNLLELAIVQNLQELDLNIFEEAELLKKLLQWREIDVYDLGLRVGLSDSSIRNKIRLLDLQDEIKMAVLKKQVSEGHARALVGIKDESSRMLAFATVKSKNLTVRQVESLVKTINQNKKSKVSLNVKGIELTNKYAKQLSKRTNVICKIRANRFSEGGSIVIKYKNEEMLKNIMKLISGE